MKETIAMAHLTQILAEHALSIKLDALPPDLQEITLSCILDLLTAAVAGTGSQGPEALLAAADQLYGAGQAPAWFSGRCLSLQAALLHNGLSASALDLDDGHRAARGHPGASVIPTVLTLAAVLPRVSGRDILSAIIAGYDVGVRIAAAQRLSAIPTRQTGRWASFAAAAAAGRLLRLSPDTLAEAFAMAGVLAPNQRANGSSGYSRRTGNLAKEGIAFSAGIGLQAVFLSASGFTGPVDLLDYDEFYDQMRLVDRLGVRFEISRTYFKPYACCRYIHPALDALKTLSAEWRFRSDEIDRIEVESFAAALRLANAPEPDNLVALQYSLPYCLAVLILDGEEALAPISSALLHRPDLSALARRVVLGSDQEAELRFPQETLARVTVILKSGEQRTTALTTPRGDPSHPMDRAALVLKFRSVTSRRLSLKRQDGIINAVNRLTDDDAGSLLEALFPSIL
jgi:2-methylcitrate dehydratase PrpD